MHWIDVRVPKQVAGYVRRTERIKPPGWRAQVSFPTGSSSKAVEMYGEVGTKDSSVSGKNRHLMALCLAWFRAPIELGLRRIKFYNKSKSGASESWGGECACRSIWVGAVLFLGEAGLKYWNRWRLFLTA
jgi:hypothetical protein